MLRTVSHRAQDERVGAEHQLRASAQMARTQMGKLSGAAQTEMTRGKCKNVHVTMTECPACKARGYPDPVYEAGNTGCPAC